MSLADLHAATLAYLEAERALIGVSVGEPARKLRRQWSEARDAYLALVYEPQLVLEVVELAMQATGEVVHMDPMQAQLWEAS